MKLYLAKITPLLDPAFFEALLSFGTKESNASKRSAAQRIRQEALRQVFYWNMG